MVRMILGSFSDLHINDPSVYHELYQPVVGAGYLVFSLESRVAVWAILNAFVLLGLALALRGGNIKDRAELKSKIVKTVIVALLLINVVAFVGCSLQAGLDMF